MQKHPSSPTALVKESCIFPIPWWKCFNFFHVYKGLAFGLASNLDNKIYSEGSSWASLGRFRPNKVPLLTRFYSSLSVLFSRIDFPSNFLPPAHRLVCRNCIAGVNGEPDHIFTRGPPSVSKECIPIFQ